MHLIVRSLTIETVRAPLAMLRTHLHYELLHFDGFLRSCTCVLKYALGIMCFQFTVNGSEMKLKTSSETETEVYS